MFASRITGQVTLQSGGADVVVNIHALSGKALRKAAEARQIDAARSAGALGHETLKALRSEQQGAAAVAAALTAEQRYALYDRELVIQAGVSSWSAPEQVNPENLGDLKDSDAEKLHRAILDISLDPIDPVAQKAAEKND